MHHKEYLKATGMNLFYMFTLYLFFPFIGPYMKSFGFDDFQTSIIFAILPLTFIVGSPIVGKLADTFGRKKMILVGLIIEIVALLFFVYGTYWWIFSLAMIANAIGYSAVVLIALAWVEDSLSDKERGKYTGISLSAVHVGKLVAPVVGGLLADYLFVQAPFLIAAVLILILAFMLASKNPKLKKNFDKNNFNFVKSLKRFLKVKPLKGMAALGIVMHATNPALSLFLPIFIIEKLGLGYSEVGVAMFFLGITHVLQFYFGSLNDKFGRATMVLFGCSFFALFLFFTAFVTSYNMLLILLFFVGIGSSIWNISAWTLMSDIGEKINHEGEVVGSYMSIANFGGLLSFVFAGLIVQVLGISALYIINAFLIAIGVLVASYYFTGIGLVMKKLGKSL